LWKSLKAANQSGNMAKRKDQVIMKKKQQKKYKNKVLLAGRKRGYKTK